jgi:hypothetical protein
MKVKRKQSYLSDMFSFSKLSAFAKCPRYAFYKYVVRQKVPPAEYFLLGRAAHAGQEYDNLSRTQGVRPTQGQVLDCAVNRYEEEGGADLDSFAKEHKQQLASFWESGERDRIQPIPDTIEAAFEIDVACSGEPDREPKKPATVQGFVDVLSKEEDVDSPVVIDYKTVKRAVTDSDAENSTQVDLYMLGAGATAARLISFVKYARQKARTKVTQTVHLVDWKRLKLLTFLSDTITSFRKNLKSGDFPKCSPGCFWCSPTACEYYEQCYPEKDPGIKRFISVEEVRPVGTLDQPEWRK